MLFNYFNDINFAEPRSFALFALLPLLIIWYAIRRNKQYGAVTISDASAKGLTSFKNIFFHFPFVLRLLAVSCIIIALAKPQTKNQLQQTEGEGIDIVLCIDVSGSMTAQDFKPNRLEAAKNIAVDFVNQRPADRIGVVIFAGESFTQCPITTDHDVLLSAIKNIHNGLLEDGTAIGNGLSTGVDRLRASQSKSKIIILLTDGVNNMGLIDPNTAKEIAKAFAIKVYTIGMGTDGMAPQLERNRNGEVIVQNIKVQIDEKLLKQIAYETGGKYFRAKDNDGLAKIYTEINGLEKSKVTVSTLTRYNEEFFPFVIAALALLFF